MMISSINDDVTIFSTTNTGYQKIDQPAWKIPENTGPSGPENVGYFVLLCTTSYFFMNLLLPMVMHNHHMPKHLKTKSFWVSKILHEKDESRSRV